MAEDNGQKLSFETKLQQVQEMITQIESGKLPLEQSVKQYEEGMKILSELDSELSEMNRRISILQDGKESEPADEIV